MSTIFKGWDHRLKLSDILSAAPERPNANDVTEAAKKVAERLEKFRDRLRDEDPLWDDIDNCIEDFADLADIDNDYEARDRFNDALNHLYNEADAGKRVWIE